MQSIEQVSALRPLLWQSGFHCIPVENAQLGDKLSGKQPFAGKQWQITPETPPIWVRQPAVDWALNTGIVCNGLRVVDFDIDDAKRFSQCFQAMLTLLPAGWLRRCRAGSPRCAVMFRAAEGEPHKLTLAGKHGKIEVLGKGNQFVAFGTHYETLAELEWPNGAPGEVRRDELPTVTEQELHGFLSACAGIIDAPPPGYTNGKAHAPEAAPWGSPEGDPLDLAADLRDIPNRGPPDWEKWNAVAMGIWAATGHADVGWTLLDAWSRRNAAYDPAITREKWEHIFRSPADRTGAGKFRKMARDAREQAGRPDYDEAEGIPFSTFADVGEAAECLDFIEGLLIMGALSVFFGPANCGKSFLLLDMAITVAARPFWRDLVIDRGAVLYLSLEGGRQAIENRILAIRQREGWDGYDLPFALITVPVDLRHPDAHVGALIATVQQVRTRFVAAECPVRWIIVDTLSRALAGGNENASEDMGALINCCDRLRAATGCHLTLIAHTGKDADRGIRGHSLTGGAIDTAAEVSVGEDGTRTVTVVKQRDLPALPAFAFKLLPVEIGTNRRGKPITTCLVEYEGTPQPRKAAGKGREPSHADRALEILANACAKHGRTGDDGVPPDFCSVPADWWRERWNDQAMPGELPDTKSKAFRRASASLLAQHKVGMNGNRVWIARPEEYQE